MYLYEALPAILSFVVVIFISVVTYVYTKNQKDNEKRFDKNENRMDEIETNYLSRFEALNRYLNLMEKNIIAEINKTMTVSNESLQKIQFNTELYYQRKDNCLVHGQEIKELKKEIEEIKRMLLPK